MHDITDFWTAMAIDDDDTIGHVDWAQAAGTTMTDMTFGLEQLPCR